MKVFDHEADMRAVRQIQNGTVKLSAGISQLPPCTIRQWGDTTGCIAPGCALRWDTNDPHPPQCPSFAVAGPKDPGRVWEAQRRLSALYSTPRSAWGGMWPVYTSFIFAAGYLGWEYGPLIVVWLLAKLLSL